MRLPSQDPPARRRLAVLGAAALAALVAGVVAGAGSDGQAKREARKGGAAAARPIATLPERRLLSAARRMSLSRQVGQLVIMPFNGTGPPAYVPRALRAGRAAGVILFRQNIASRAAIRALVRRLQRGARGSAIICTDQEGGAIRNLGWAAPTRSQAATSTPARASAAAAAAARDLRAAGVNVNLAPVADVASARGSVMRSRAFPGRAQSVAALTAAAVRGYRGTGVAPAVKHFPGLGAATRNTDFAAVTLPRTPQQIVAHDLPPFRAAIAAKAPLIMASHAVYPALDGDAIASQSRYVLQRLLRERLGFRGVVVTDSLQARAVTVRSGPGRAAVRSVRAGADLVLTTGAGNHLRVVRALLAEARRSAAFRRRVAESVARVLALKHALKLPAPVR
ncbi:MAG TPA: glycoside hydrolase family 3 N-terminal domain-containing protein [Solirubrobacteraceae bacterium]|nr:glycoside hydrolase family 3 N-terminal domain-containing protein [Solirubrobacteraceae bacterium]